MREYIRLTKVVFDTLEQLSDSQLDDILNNRAKLSIEYVNTEQKEHTQEIKEISDKVDKTPNKVATVAIPSNIEEIVNKLNTTKTREDASKLLASFKKDQLRDIANHFEIPVGASYTKEKLKISIVEGVIGAKLHHDVLLNTNLGGSKK